ncbi:hypothetical protein [Chitinimonas sp.]|uniref:hypothetical protein n=1 Tax=Chitinimonas sp. TaxID=1934313 RepID=UPI0035AEB65D
MSNIEDRLALVLQETGEPYGFWRGLEAETGISAQRWKAVVARRQRVTSDMLQAACRWQPQYAFWLATGITDASNGHIAPMNALTFPERLYAAKPEAETYFRRCFELQDRLFAEARVDSSNDEQRMAAISRIKVLAHWIGSNLVDIAYRLAKTPEYRELLEIFERREKKRAATLELRGKTLPGMPETLGSTMLGQDPRTQHQRLYDLHWIARDD